MNNCYLLILAILVVLCISQKDCLGCSSCMYSPPICLSCRTNRIKQGNFCICKDGYYDFSGAGQDCNKCPDGCAKCDNQGICEDQLSNSDLMKIIMINLAVVGTAVIFVCVFVFVKKCVDERRSNRLSNNLPQLGRQQSSTAVLEVRQKKLKEKMNYKEELCSICIDEEIPATFMTDCAHYFHAKCLSQWMCKGKNCPNCNLNIIPHYIGRWCTECRNQLLEMSTKLITEDRKTYDDNRICFKGKNQRIVNYIYEQKCEKCKCRVRTIKVRREKFGRSRIEDKDEDKQNIMNHNNLQSNNIIIVK